jgi:hypothetical protein
MRVIFRRLCCVLIAEAFGARGPWVVEARKVIIDIEHDRRNSNEGSFLDNPPQEHGLARAGACEDCDVTRQPVDRKRDDITLSSTLITAAYWDGPHDGLV